jgi:TPR repeat protein
MTYIEPHAITQVNHDVAMTRLRGGHNVLKELSAPNDVALSDRIHAEFAERRVSFHHARTAVQYHDPHMQDSELIMAEKETRADEESGKLIALHYVKRFPNMLMAYLKLFDKAITYCEKTHFSDLRWSDVGLVIDPAEAHEFIRAEELYAEGDSQKHLLEYAILGGRQDASHTLAFIQSERSKLDPEEPLPKFGKISSVAYPDTLYAYGEAINDLGYVKSAAALGHAEAQYFLGEHCEEWGSTKMEIYRKKMAKKDSNRSQAEATRLKQEAMDAYAKAAAYYHEAADQKHPAACVKYGLLYFDGDGVPKNHVKAAELFAEAAKFGDPKGQENLAYCYLRGAGVTQNYETAFELYCKSIKQGNTHALEDLKRYADEGDVKIQIQLGRMYEKGVALPKDGKLALKYYHMAAKQASTEAYYRLGRVHEKGYEFGERDEFGKRNKVGPDLASAQINYSKAAERDHLKAQYRLGLTHLNLNYENDEIAKENYAFALDLFKDSEDRGLPKSKIGIGFMYYDGKGVDRNEGAAFKYFSEAAKAGSEKGTDLLFKHADMDNNPEAHYRLGKAFEAGEILPMSIEKAIERYKSASRNNFEKATQRLKQLHDASRNNTEADSMALVLYQSDPEKDLEKEPSDYQLLAQKARHGDAQAAKILEYHARSGNPHAQLRFGSLHLKSNNPFEAQEARTMIREAAINSNNGMAKAIYELLEDSNKS